METKLYHAGLCILCNSMLCCKEFGRNTCGKLFFHSSIPSPGAGDNLTPPCCITLHCSEGFFRSLRLPEEDLTKNVEVINLDTVLVVTNLDAAFLLTRPVSVTSGSAASWETKAFKP